MAKLHKLSSLTLVESVCGCSRCQSFCRHRPCWPTPDEVRKLIDAGHAERLMIDWWGGNSFRGEFTDIPILCPAGVGHEKDDADEGDMFLMRPPRMKCVMFKGGLCALHDTGMKPVEGRCTSCKESESDSKLHGAVADSWNNPDALGLVWQWMKQVDYRGKYRDEVEAWAKENEPQHHLTVL